MNQIRLSVLFLLLGTLGACGGNLRCEKKEFYESSRLGEPVVVPEDLDNPESYKELKIPQPSGDSERTADEGCIDKPPRIWKRKG